MNDYEQMSSSDSAINDSSNPFSKNKKGKGFSEIIQSKNSLRKYIIAIIICVFFIYFIVLTINKSSQVKTLNEEISSLETEMKGFEEGTEKEVAETLESESRKICLDKKENVDDISIVVVFINNKYEMFS